MLAISLKRERLIPIIVSFIILSQIRSSFTWTFSFEISSVLLLLLLLLLYINKRNFIFPNKLSFFALFIAVLIFVCLNFQVSSLLTLFAYISTFRLTDQSRDKILFYLNSFLSIIIGVSLLCWLLHFNGIFEFPLYRLLDLSLVGNDGYLEDYFFFIHNPDLLFPRFYAIFEEPGALGVLLSFVIVANRFNFKEKKILVIILGLIFTYSLAGYLLFFAGFVFQKVKKLKLFFLYLGILILVLTFLYYLLKDVKVLQWLIFDRLANFNEQGLTHRTSDNLNTFFTSYWTSYSSILGMGEGYCNIHFTGFSYRMFIIDYGWLGLIALFLLYYSIYMRYGKKAISIPIVYFLAFLPQYRAFISWQILLFSVSCYIVSKNET